MTGSAGRLEDFEKRSKEENNEKSDDHFLTEVFRDFEMQNSDEANIFKKNLSRVESRKNEKRESGSSLQTTPMR